MSNHYWYRQIIPDSSNKNTGLREIEIPTAKAFISHLSSDGKKDLDPKATNSKLLYLMDGDFNKREAQCLRCYVSQQIKFTCKRLTDKHGEMGGFENKDIFPYALEDFIEEKKIVASEILAIKILSTFNPSKAQLSTWTRFLVHRHSEIVKFLKAHDISPWTDWGLLNGATAQHLENAATSLQVELKEAKKLLACFQRVYGVDRRRKTEKCAPPTPGQLQEMSNLLGYSSSEDSQLMHEFLKSKLELIAEGLRNWKMGGKRISGEKIYEKRKSEMDGTRVTGEYAEVVDEADQREIFDADENQDELLGDFRDELLREIERVTRIQVAQEYERQQRAKKGEPEVYLQLLQLRFEQGMDQIPIAIELGWTKKGQGQVSRLLKKLYRDIGDGVFNELQSRNIIPSDFNENHDKFESIKELIREYLDEDIIVDNRTQTVISQAICKYLRSRGEK